MRLLSECHCLDDTVLPAGLTVDEEREACRALKGSMLRQEVYALDGSGTKDYPHGHPYTVTEQNFNIQRLQPQAGNRHAVFLTHARESINYYYEREPADPRISHALTLEVDGYGNVLKEIAIGYGRRSAPTDPALTAADKAKQTRSLITYTENSYTNLIDDATKYSDAYRTHDADLVAGRSADKCTTQLLLLRRLWPRNSAKDPGGAREDQRGRRPTALSRQRLDHLQQQGQAGPPVRAVLRQYP